MTATSRERHAAEGRHARASACGSAAQRSYTQKRHSAASRGAAYVHAPRKRGRCLGASLGPACTIFGLPEEAFLSRFVIAGNLLCLTLASPLF